MMAIVLMYERALGGKMEWGNGLLSFRLVLLFCFHVFGKQERVLTI